MTSLDLGVHHGSASWAQPHCAVRVLLRWTPPRGFDYSATGDPSHSRRGD